MAIYELGISIDGIPGLFNKYYDFEKSYKELTEYSQGIRQNILAVISHKFTTASGNVYSHKIENDLFVYLFSMLYRSSDGKRKSFYSAYIISNETIDKSIAEPLMRTILEEFVKFRPVPVKNKPINNNSLLPFRRILEKTIKDSALKPVERLKQSLFCSGTQKSHF